MKHYPLLRILPAIFGTTVLLSLVFLSGAGSRVAATRLETQAVADITAPQTGNLQIQLHDSHNKDAITGADVCLDFGATCLTDQGSGVYLVNGVTAITHSLQITADGWINVSETVKIEDGATTDIYVGLPVPPEDGNGDPFDHYVQIVLTWDAPWYPSDPDAADGDLDAHLYISQTNWTTGTFHINAGDDTSYGDCDTDPYACLASNAGDEFQGYGPEAVDIVTVKSGAITSYGVLNFWNGYSGVPPISDTLATVRVFEGLNHIATYKVPETELGVDFWYVMDINDVGDDIQLTDRNCIISYPNENLPSCGDEPEYLIYLPLVLR